MGNAGVGKRKFAESIYYYALEKHILQENAQFIIINCQDYAHSDDRLMAGLLGLRRSGTPGVKPAKGLIEAAGHGIVYFDGLHKLPSKSIDLIIDILKNGSYTRIGDNHPRPLEAMFIASVRSSLEPELLDNIKDAFPVMISLPDFDKRNSLEKIQTILYLFTREAFSIQKNLKAGQIHHHRFCHVQLPKKRIPAARRNPVGLLQSPFGPAQRRFSFHHHRF